MSTSARLELDVLLNVLFRNGPGADPDSSLAPESRPLRSHKSRNGRQQPALELETLMSRCVAGDDSALDALHRMTSSRLIVVAERITHNRHAAEEVVQESFMNLWKHAALYKPSRGHAMTWMASVVRNRAIDHIRQQRPSLNAQVSEAEIENLIDPGPTPDEQLEGKLQAARVRYCLARLPPLQRQLIALAFNCGLSHHEISREMGIPLGTVKSLIRRGLQAIRSGYETPAGPTLPFNR